MIEKQINEAFNRIQMLQRIQAEYINLLEQLILKRRQLEEEKEGEKDG